MARNRSRTELNFSPRDSFHGKGLQTSLSTHYPAWGTLGEPPPDARSAKPGAIGSDSRRAEQRGERILIVEDEAITALYLEQMLQELGYVVCATASTAPEAIAVAAREKPDLVLMDIRLAEGTDGIDAAREIRNRLGTPSIFVTAHTDAAMLERAQDTRPLGFLTKPYSQKELGLVLRQALDQLKRN